MADYRYTPFGAVVLTPAKKRRAYFAFHFDDIMRVNNVRNAWKIDHPDAPNNRSFLDSSLWESQKLEGDDALKRLIREGVEYSSAVCVLVGTETCRRRWVRYEVARSVIDRRGLLAVHINGLNHHVRLRPCPLGENPLNYLGITKVQQNTLLRPTYRLVEWTSAGRWEYYADHTTSVERPVYLRDPAPGQVVQLAEGSAVYDFTTARGHTNIGAWIDEAAKKVDR